MKTVNESEIRKRLKGKKESEIEKLVSDYLDASNAVAPDFQVIDEILAKSQADAELTVKTFRLTRDQYETLASVLEMPGADGAALCKKAIDELISLAS